MSVHRLTPLPVGPVRGRLVVNNAVIEATKSALQRFAGADGRHEGVVFWLGRVVGADTYVLSALVPRADHGRGRVIVSETDVGLAARAARRRALAIVAQVHSHPGDDTRHSDGDDRLVLMPFEGMFSVVVARYGDGGLIPDEGVGLHQYQDGRWVKIDASEGTAMMVVAPLLV